MIAREPFLVDGQLPRGRTVLEASAGTGKTYSLTALITRYIAELGVPVDEILVVTFTRAAANELRERTRHTLSEAADALAPGGTSASHAWMHVLDEADNLFETSVRRQRILDALSDFDDLTITTIHGFCQQALGQLGLRSGGNPESVLVENTRDLVAEVCRDLLVVELADDPLQLSAVDKPKKPGQVETELVETVMAVLTNPGARREPAARGDGELGDLVDEMETARRWSEIVDRAVDEVHHRQRTRSQIGYDSLIAGLAEALGDPVRGQTVAEQLATRYRVVLVDEFQDTDELQWRVFETAFGSGSLITVGDPKQAIYRFRGADVHAYLAAVRDEPTFDLAVNHRSDRQLLEGLAHLFSGATLGDDRIAFGPVEARPDAPDNALGDGPAVHLRVVPIDDRLRRTRSVLAVPLVRPLVLADLVGRTIELLDHGTITTADGERAVVPGDIAVLVPSHMEAHHVAEAMQRAGIPAVRTRTGSVLASPAVLQWRLLLAALARPHQASLVRAAALGWFLSTDIERLAGDDADDLLIGLQEHAAQLADQLRRLGLASFYDRQKSEGIVLDVVLGQVDGDRHLTDLDHIAELLAAELHGGVCDAPTALRVLESMVASDDERSEATMRRIDSDALAVQITTIHAAKGLEYPIVLVPFSFKPRVNTRTPYSFNNEAEQRVLDVASTVPWDGSLQLGGDDASRYNQEYRKHLANLENDGDALRLLYVALTRAQHRLEVWWASTTGAKSSALGRLLLDRDGGGPARNSEVDITFTRTGKRNFNKPAFTRLGETEAEAQVLAFAAESSGTIALTMLPAHLEHPTWHSSTAASTDQLATAGTDGRAAIADPAWKRWSFTRLASTADQRVISSGVGDVGGFGGGPEPDIADPTGGNDEPVEATDGAVIAPRDVVAANGLGDPATTGSAGHLIDVIGGTTFGTFVHSVLEGLDFTSATIEVDVRGAVVAEALRYGLGVDVDAITAGVVDVLRTPLGPLFGGRALADIAPLDRLAELTFDVPIGEGHLPAAALGDALVATLAPDDPVLPFAHLLRDEFAGIDIAGWMHGSIDAVFRIEGGGDHTRYVVVDYKTNRLHRDVDADPLEAYRPAALIEAMEHHRYPLQALLYSIALHRYLRWRLGAPYEPEQHLGGIAYLFVRGMIGAATPVDGDESFGVFSWRPPAATIIALDDLLANGGVP